MDEPGLYRAFLDASGKVHRVNSVERDLRSERDQLILPVFDVDTVDFTAIANDDGFSVREKCVAGQQVAGEATLLVVTGDGYFNQRSSPVFKLRMRRPVSVL